MDTIIKDMNPVLQMLILMTVFSLIPLLNSLMPSTKDFIPNKAIIPKAIQGI